MAREALNVKRSIVPDPQMSLQEAVDFGPLAGLAVGDMFHGNSPTDFSGEELTAVHGVLFVGSVYKLSSLSPAAVEAGSPTGSDLMILESNGRILNNDDFEGYQTFPETHYFDRLLVPEGASEVTFNYTGHTGIINVRTFLCVADSSSALLETTVQAGRTGENDLLVFDNQTSSAGDQYIVDLSQFTNARAGSELILRANLAYGSAYDSLWNFYSGDRKRNTIYHRLTADVPDAYGFYPQGMTRFLFDENGSMALEDWVDGNYENRSFYTPDAQPIPSNSQFVSVEFDAIPRVGTHPLRVQFENKSVVS